MNSTDAVRQHYLLATTGGVQPAPKTDPGNFIKPSEAGTAKNPHPNPMTTKRK